MKLPEKEASAYEAEHQNIAERLMREMPPFKEAEQLLELVQTHFSLAAQDTRHPKVVILGSGFPEELVYAFGVTPYWVLGGSLQTGAWAGELAPRDADPVSRSMLGLMLELEELSQEALVLLPIVSDSTRKIAYLLRRVGMKVHTIDVPPVKDESAPLKYKRQLEQCAEAISAHTRRRLTRRALRCAASLVALAHNELHRFLRLTDEKPALISEPWRMLVSYSYYCTCNLPQWTRLVARLNDKMEASRICGPGLTNGKVLLIGSPIYFPNYKIPFLLQDVGLHVTAHLDYTTQRVKTALNIEEALEITLSRLAQKFYQADCSGSYAKNETLQAAASELLDSRDVDGVVSSVQLPL